MNELNSLRLLIRNILAEDYRFEYNKKHTPTDSMVSSVKKAQQAIAKNNLIQNYKAPGGIVTGERRSGKLLAKTPLTHNEVRAIRDLFTALHADYTKEKSKGLSIDNSAVLQIWELNGGSAGKTWAEGILGQHHDSSLKHKDLRRGYGDVGIVKNMMKPRLAKRQNPK